jgi:hypothetical protein
LRFTFLDRLAGLEGGGPQLFQLLLRRVVGRLLCLGPGGRVPQGGPQAWKPRTRKIKMGANPRRKDQQNRERISKQEPDENKLTFNLLLLHLEGLARLLGLALQLEVRGLLLLEGLALVLVRDADLH